MAFEQTVRLLKAKGSPEEFRKYHAAVARQELARVLAEADDKPSVIRYVDGREGAVEESVRFGGIIRYEFIRLARIAQDALELARQLSPSGPGLMNPGSGKKTPHYRDAWFLMVDGKEVAGKVPANAREITLTNDQPYHRKLEMTVNSDGMVGQKGVFRRPAGICEKIRQRLLRKYGDSFSASVSFIDLEGAYVLKGGGRSMVYLKDVPSRGIRAGMRRPLKRDRAKGARMTYPALIISTL